MHTVLADLTVSITELKKNPTSVINEAAGEPIAILNNNKPTAYLLSAKMYEAIFELMEDQYLGKIAARRLEKERELAVKVNVDDLV